MKGDNIDVPEEDRGNDDPRKEDENAVVIQVDLFDQDSGAKESPHPSESHSKPKKGRWFQKKSQEEKKTESQGSLRRIFRLLKGKYGILFVGTVCAVIAGGSLPAFSDIFGNVLNVLMPCMPSDGPDCMSDKQHQLLIYSMSFLAMGAGTMIFSFIQTLCFGWLGEVLVVRIRHEYFKALLRQDVEFYDQTKTGELTSRYGV